MTVSWALLVVGAVVVVAVLWMNPRFATSEAVTSGPLWLRLLVSAAFGAILVRLAVSRVADDAERVLVRGLQVTFLALLCLGLGIQLTRQVRQHRQERRQGRRGDASRP